MTKRYARVENGVVLEIIVLDAATEQAFHPDIAATLKECAAQVEVGWLLKGSKFEAPVAAAPTLDAVKAARIETLRAACEATITGGFKSTALGDAHTYPSDIKAQINLMGSVTDSIMPDLPTSWTTPFWVCDAAQVWAWKMHNAGQIQQAGRDGKAHVVQCQSTLAALSDAVSIAETQEDVEAIAWPVA